MQNNTEWIKVLDFDNIVRAQAKVGGSRGELREQAYLGGWQVYGAVSEATLTAVLTYSSIGKVDVEPIQEALNFALSYVRVDLM